MGQRSQIYIRFNDNGRKRLIARYFNWNYGERMISRARYIMEWLMGHQEYLILESQGNKLIKIMEVNFDMIDCVDSSDIIQEYINAQWKTNNILDFKGIVFEEQDNNDGQLYIDVTDDGIKYAFIDPYEIDHEIMDAEKYMVWDYNESNKSYKELKLDQDILASVENNSKWLKFHAELMTEKELGEFLEYDYSWQLPSKILRKRKEIMEDKKVIEITVEKTIRLCKTLEATKKQIEDLQHGFNPFEDRFSDKEMEDFGDIEYDYAVADENGRTIVDWN